MIMPMPATCHFISLGTCATNAKSLLKKKFPIKTFEIVTPRHSIKLSERVVRVVANAPIANAVYVWVKTRLRKGEQSKLTGLPSVLFTVLGTKKGYGFPCGVDNPFAVLLSCS